MHSISIGHWKINLFDTGYLNKLQNIFHSIARVRLIILKLSSIHSSCILLQKPNIFIINAQQCLDNSIHQTLKLKWSFNDLWIELWWFNFRDNTICLFANCAISKLWTAIYVYINRYMSIKHFCMINSKLWINNVDTSAKCSQSAKNRLCLARAHPCIT